MTDKRVLTIEEARERLIRIVEEKGRDYVYHAPDSASREDVDAGVCLYCEYEDGFVDATRATGPSCVIGHLLVDLGVPLEEISYWEGTAASEAVYPYFIMAPALEDALGKMQQHQDRGETWGNALDTFNKIIAEAPEDLKRIE